jgi:hypothetical protein
LVNGKLVVARDDLTSGEMMLGPDEAARKLNLPFHDDGPVWPFDPGGAAKWK